VAVRKDRRSLESTMPPVVMPKNARFLIPRADQMQLVQFLFIKNST
jgi:hypothetical protein